MAASQTPSGVGHLASECAFEFAGRATFDEKRYEVTDGAVVEAVAGGLDGIGDTSWRDSRETFHQAIFNIRD